MKIVHSSLNIYILFGTRAVRNGSHNGGLAALKLAKLLGIDDFPAAKDSGKVLIIIIYCYLIINIIIIIIIIIITSETRNNSK